MRAWAMSMWCATLYTMQPPTLKPQPTKLKPCLLVHLVGACGGDEHVVCDRVHYASHFQTQTLKAHILEPYPKHPRPQTLLFFFFFFLKVTGGAHPKPCLLVHLVGASVGDEHVVSHLIHLTCRVHCAAWGVLATTVMAQHSSTPAHSTACMQQVQHSAAQHTSIQQDPHTRWTSNSRPSSAAEQPWPLTRARSGDPVYSATCQQLNYNPTIKIIIIIINVLISKNK